jgi:hypothetical protein
MNAKIEKYYPHLYLGQNTESSYRLLGFLPLLCKGYEQSKLASTLYSRYRYPADSTLRLIPFSPITNSAKKLFERTVPVYIVFDIIYRNCKFNNNKSNEYKLYYTLDLLIYHSVATFTLPYMFFGLFTKNIVPRCSILTRRRIPLIFISTLIYFGFTALLIKGTDILSDALLDVTYRKYIFDFKKDFTGFRKFETFETPEDKIINEYLNRSGNKIIALDKIEIS